MLVGCVGQMTANMVTSVTNMVLLYSYFWFRLLQGNKKCLNILDQLFCNKLWNLYILKIYIFLCYVIFISDHSKFHNLIFCTIDVSLCQLSV